MADPRNRAVVGVRKESKSIWERRTPLIPEDVRSLVNQGLGIHVQRSAQRCFPDQDFARAGATLTDDLAAADVILGVKEVPLDELEPGKTWLFFSHTIKGQPYNMPLLRRLLVLGSTLLDYELVTDDHSVRTIAFGRHAGLAGAIDTLWALGRRFAQQGFDTPLAQVEQALEYGELAKARADLEAVGRAIAEQGLPEELSPLVVGVTGAGGKVFGGAMEVLDFLPTRHVDPEDLAQVAARRSGRAHEILAVGYGPEHLVEPVDAARQYSFGDYVANPGRYRACFGAHLGRLSAVIHGIFWAEGYPRFILREDLAALWAADTEPRLQVITDITCDPGGSNESLVQVGDPGHPSFVYDPFEHCAKDGWDGPGPVVVAVDILPTEIPVDSSRHFSERLTPLVPALARGIAGPEDPAAPAQLRRAMIAHEGRLLPAWLDRLTEPLRLHGGE